MINYLNNLFVKSGVKLETWVYIRVKVEKNFRNNSKNINVISKYFVGMFNIYICNCRIKKTRTKVLISRKTNHSSNLLNHF